MANVNLVNKNPVTNKWEIVDSEKDRQTMNEWETWAKNQGATKINDGNKQLEILRDMPVNSGGKVVGFSMGREQWYWLLD